MHRDLKKESRITIILLVCIALLLAILALFSVTYFKATQPMKQAKQEATALAEKYGDVTQVDAFYRYTRNDTYYAIFGENKNNQAVIVLIPSSGKNVQVLNQSDGLSMQQAKAVVAKTAPKDTFERASLGMNEKQIVWEIVTKDESNQYHYYLVQFSDGKLVSEIS